jgi:PAS domain S-box-containing protein
MQNSELQESRDQAEALLEKYMDLYDFAPVGYLSVDEHGQILEVNLTAAALLGLEKSRLVGQFLSRFVVPASRLVLLAFLKKLFTGAGKQACEAALARAGGAPFWSNLHGAAASSASGPEKCCRVVISDITALKATAAAQRRLDALAETNQELREEIIRRRAMEDSLKKSELHQSELLAKSHLMQEQLRQLSRRVLKAQEEERKRISRELHDVIAQTLAGIKLRLAALTKMSRVNPASFARTVAHTQRLVEKSVDVIHQFARELRPAVLDDLGLIPALHSFMKRFTEETGVRTHLTAYAGVNKLEPASRTVFFRVAQEALTNVARHAQASQVKVSIYELPQCVCMEVKDDGKSFQAERVLERTGEKRLGVLGMRERLEMVGGRFNVESSPGKGTTVIAQTPYGSNARVKKPLPASVRTKIKNL